MLESRWTRSWRRSRAISNSRREFVAAASAGLRSSSRRTVRPRRSCPPAIRRSSRLPPAARWSPPAARASPTAPSRRGRIPTCASAASSPCGTSQSGKRLFRWETFGDLTKLAFSPDGTLLAAARLFETDDGLALHEVRVWDVTTGRLVKSLDRCHSFDFSPDGRQLAVLSRSKCVVYDVKDWAKETLVKPLGGAVSVSFAADGLSLVGVVKDDGKYRLRLASMEAGQDTVGEAPAPIQSLALDQPFYRVAVAADGTLLATGHDGGNVVVWDATTLDLRSRLQHGRAWPGPSVLLARCQAPRRRVPGERRRGDLESGRAAGGWPLHVRKRWPADLSLAARRRDVPPRARSRRASASRPTASRFSSAPTAASCGPRAAGRSCGGLGIESPQVMKTAVAR